MSPSFYQQIYDRSRPMSDAQLFLQPELVLTESSLSQLFRPQQAVINVQVPYSSTGSVFSVRF